MHSASWGTYDTEFCTRLEARTYCFAVLFELITNCVRKRNTYFSSNTFWNYRKTRDVWQIGFLNMHMIFFNEQIHLFPCLQGKKLEDSPRCLSLVSFFLSHALPLLFTKGKEPRIVSRRFLHSPIIQIYIFWLNWGQLHLKLWSRMISFSFREDDKRQINIQWTNKGSHIERIFSTSNT